MAGAPARQTCTGVRCVQQQIWIIGGDMTSDVWSSPTSHLDPVHGASSLGTAIPLLLVFDTRSGSWVVRHSG